MAEAEKKIPGKITPRGFFMLHVRKQNNSYMTFKTEEQFIASLKGEKGENGQAGASGATGESAYQVWKELQKSDGSKPNENKSEQDFFNSLKGKDGQDGKNGVAADVTVKASEKGKDINEARFVINTQKPEMTFVGDSNIKTSIEKDTP